MKPYLTYVNNVFDNTPKQLTPTILDQLLDAEQTHKATEAYRTSGEEKHKKSLPAIIFNGLFSAELSEKWIQQDGSHTPRQDANFVASPFIGLDIDLKGNPAELYATALERIREKLHRDPWEFIPLAYASPGRGLRIVALRQPGLTLEQDRQRWEKLLELPCDPACKNLSRLYLLTSRTDLLHYNPQMLFNLEGHNPDAFNNEIAEKEVLQGVYTAPNTDSHTSPTSQPSTEMTFSEEELTDIAEELAHIIGGGKAQKGGRNQLTYEIAKQMRHITGDNPHVLEKVIPMHEETYLKHREAISNALRYGKKMPYFPQDLQNAMDRVMKGEHLEMDMEDPVPEMPKILPPAMQTLLDATPKKSRPAVAMAVFSALRILLHEVKFQYIDRTAQEPCFLNICIAEQASGKTALRPPTRAILHELEKQDEMSRMEEAEWRETCSTLSANQERPKQPDSPIRIVQADMTSPALVKLMRRASGYSLYTYGEELEKLLRLQGASEIIRSAFDCEEYGQERVGVHSVCDVVRLKWSIVYSTTPATALRILKNEVSNGTLTRLSLSTIQTDENDWGELTPIYGEYSEAYIKEIDAFTSKLKKEPSGTLICQEAIDWVEKEKIRQIDQLKLMDAKYMLPFLWRSLLMAFWRACIIYIMQGKQWSTAIEEFATWSLNYDLWVKTHYFGQLIENLSTTNNFTNRHPKMLLPLLPETFTRDEARMMRRRIGKDASARAVTNMLGTWVHRGFIRYNAQTKKYQKLPLTTQSS